MFFGLFFLIILIIGSSSLVVKDLVPADVPQLQTLSEDTEPYTICYINDWSIFRRGKGRYGVEDIDYEQCTHIIYTFALLDEETKDTIIPGEPYIDVEQNFYQKVTELKNYGPKVMLALGGWVDSTPKYGEMLRNDELRRHLVLNITDFLVKHNFDGLEVDILYPGSYQADESTGTPQDKEYFLSFLRELRDNFDYKAHELNRDRFLLSIGASSLAKTIERSYLIPGVIALCDWIDVITYNFHGFWDNRTGLVAPFSAQPGDEEIEEASNVQKAMDVWLNSGAPANKLVVGVPFYGRNFKLADPNLTSINSPTEGLPDCGEFTRYPGYLSYYEIIDRVKNKGWTVVHNKQMGSYAFKDDQWVGFDDKYDVAVKADYVKTKGFRGVAVWSLDLDCFQKDCPAEQHPLLHTVRGVLTGELNAEDVEYYL